MVKKIIIKSLVTLIMLVFIVGLLPHLCAKIVENRVEEATRLKISVTPDLLNFVGRYKATNLKLEAEEGPPVKVNDVFLKYDPLDILAGKLKVTLVGDNLIIDSGEELGGYGKIEFKHIVVTAILDRKGNIKICYLNASGEPGYISLSGRVSAGGEIDVVCSLMIRNRFLNKLPDVLLKGIFPGDKPFKHVNFTVKGTVSRPQFLVTSDLVTFSVK